MRILVIGRNGQVARSLAEVGPEWPQVEMTFTSRPEVDLAIPGSLPLFIREARADVVINAAAFTAVDKAETEEDRAQRINGDAAGEGANAARKVGARFIQLSTDYVFDGSPGRSWREEDPVSPINAYGRTKADGEAQVLAANPRNLVVRTSWVVSPFGNNFVNTMLRLARERDNVHVVDDQRGCPTSALDLARGLIQLAHLSLEREAHGIIHLANSGHASWADVADAVMSASAEVGGPSKRIKRILSSDFATPAARPKNSVLDCTKAQNWGLSMPHWKASIDEITKRLVLFNAS